MSVHNLNRNDTIKCKVVGHNQKGCFLTIVGIDENPMVRLYDSYIPKGSIVLVSIKKINENYVRVGLDSVVQVDNENYVA